MVWYSCIPIFNIISKVINIRVAQAMLEKKEKKHSARSQCKSLELYQRYQQESEGNEWVKGRGRTTETDIETNQSFEKGHL